MKKKTFLTLSLLVLFLALITYALVKPSKEVYANDINNDAIYTETKENSDLVTPENYKPELAEYIKKNP